MKILNLFAGIGSNRRLWGSKHEITSVEFEPKIAKIYKEIFPNDTLIIGDAYQYLLDHHTEFDIIWASVPCQTHSRVNNFLYPQGVIRLPDLKLYSVIIFLQKWFKGNWIVENVKPYYPYLIKPTCIRGRHPYWSNISIPSKDKLKSEIGSMALTEKAKLRGKSSGCLNKNQMENNRVGAEEGLILLKYLIGKKKMMLKEFL